MKQAKNPCLVRLTGIVIHETENAFKIITIKDQVKRGSSSHTLHYGNGNFNFVIVIPKQGVIFAFRIPLYDVRSIVDPLSHNESVSADGIPGIGSIPWMEFELYGNQFRFRAADRAGRKFKAKETIEL